MCLVLPQLVVPFPESLPPPRRRKLYGLLARRSRADRTVRVLEVLALGFVGRAGAEESSGAGGSRLRLVVATSATTIVDELIGSSLAPASVAASAMLVS
ncbi:hypothetical protein VTJ04DRAFT_3445 [Mycothermus thermophilus]|uniref:uncharacterized protein n=1 Tax=Humicola insolens TaxID=85995 RepID=UPI0037446835